MDCHNQRTVKPITLVDAVAAISCIEWWCLLGFCLPRFYHMPNSKHCCFTTKRLIIYSAAKPSLLHHINRILLLTLAIYFRSICIFVVEERKHNFILCNLTMFTHSSRLIERGFTISFTNPLSCLWDYYNILIFFFLKSEWLWLVVQPKWKFKVWKKILHNCVRF